MLKYIADGSESLIVFAVLFAVLFAYIPRDYRKYGRNFLLAASVAGLVAGIVVAYLKNKTTLVHQNVLNMYLFSFSIGLWILLLIFDTRKNIERGRFEILVSVIAAGLTFVNLVYALPDVLALPYRFVLSGNKIFSSDFILRLLGLLIGIGVTVLGSAAILRACNRIGSRSVSTLFKISYAFLVIQETIKILQEMYSKRMIKGHWLFQIIKFNANHLNYYTFVILAIATVVPVILIIRSFHVNEPYENPAQHRKIRAKWISIRRWSVTAIVCFIIVFLNITALKAYANRPVELSPIEDCEITSDSMSISFDRVSDGHLHRFAYYTDKNIEVRVIVIKKPNSSAYGVGLDACDICGETGYYERSNQVICNRCDVVMNINTIGFPGGCNPKVIDYSIENGHIVIPLSELKAHESDFK